jgi:hypothetical protein
MKKHGLKLLCIAGLALSVVAPSIAQAQYYEPIPSVYDSERVRPEDRRAGYERDRYERPRHHPQHQDRRHRQSDEDLAIGILGLATGIIIGGAIVGDDRRYAPPPPPRYRPHRPHRYDYVRAWSPEWYQWCSARYRSFNPRTGFFVARDGVRQFCDANR